MTFLVNGNKTGSVKREKADDYRWVTHEIDQHDNFTRAQFPAITVTVATGRDKKIGTALGTNHIAGLVTVPSYFICQ